MIVRASSVPSSLFLLLVLYCHGGKALVVMPHQESSNPTSNVTNRRQWMNLVAASCASGLVAPSVAAAQTDETPDNMYAPKFVQSYQDFIQTPAGWSYRDVTSPSSTSAYQAQTGDRVVYDWSGYTIGYFGRPFQAKGGPQGGAFDKDLDYERTVLGSGTVVKGLEQAMTGMTTGSVRQVIVPYTAALSYPPSDPEHTTVGPKPSTFSGMRALNFVLENPRVDRSLLFNVKVVRIDRPDGKGGFKRGL